MLINAERYLKGSIYETEEPNHISPAYIHFTSSSVSVLFTKIRYFLPS